MTWEWVTIISVITICLTAIWMQAAHHTFATQWAQNMVDFDGDND